ncbi:F-box/kelch-repeat protein At3g06240-like [Papaver somniferum]|uniref:F-box/kelch-repeat protein At3g06240-like n=1 Tax=Papaver somniferum TaxID=3469 RepID=UPI000E706089|nr:F-box/kelch-repeat protein At3g06240-like [Papaver somniferum]
MDTPFEYKNGTEVRILGACNGLICFDIISNEGTSNICIWNPTTREYKEHVDFPINLRPPPIAGLSSVGFGYNGQTGDYKIVRITTYYEKRDSCEVQVYTFGSHSSKIIHAFPYKFLGDLTFHGVLLNALRWISDASNRMVSFDISNEKFRDVPLPEKKIIIHPTDSNLYNKLGVLEDCLCLVLVTIRWSELKYG